MKRLTDAIPKISMFIVIGILVEIVSQSLNSNFVASFLEGDLISILLALLAINITTVSVILTKLQELATKGRLDYHVVITEMRVSVKEQVALLIIAAILLIMKTSQAVLNLWDLAESALTVGLVAVLAYAIFLMQNTGESVFKIAEIENQKMKTMHDTETSKVPDKNTEGNKSEEQEVAP